MSMKCKGRFKVGTTKIEFQQSIPVEKREIWFRSRTKQAPKDDADINKLVARYRDRDAADARNMRVPLDPTVSRSRTPIFGDFTLIKDFHTTQAQIVAFNDEFKRLPATLRERFANNSENLANFLGDPENHEEAVKLGLRVKPLAKAAKKKAVVAEEEEAEEAEK